MTINLYAYKLNMTTLRKQHKIPLEKTVNSFSRRKRTADEIQEEMVSDPVYGEAFAEIFKTHKIVYRDPLLRKSTPNRF